MKILIKNTYISLIKGDITLQATDAIVNAANSSLMGGGGVDGAIHRAGGPAILEECKVIIAKHGRLPAGKAVITTAGNLAARYVIHTVGPVWQGGNNNEAAILASAYTESLRLAERHNLKSVSFPSISTGAYGYPVAAAAVVAIESVATFIKEEASSIKEIVFVLFSDTAYESYTDALGKIEPL
jgi:O-acetyl-ADP-ribose deacetylase (regulator of RNase III)